MNSIMPYPNYALLNRAYLWANQDRHVPEPGPDQVVLGDRAPWDTGPWETFQPTLRPEVPHEGQAYLARLREVMAAPAPAAVAPAGNAVDPRDWHIPTLNEAFDLARRYPGKRIYLDTKTSDDPAVARRMAGQLADLFQQYPDLKERVVIMNRDPANLDAFKQEFARHPSLRDFRNFTLDNEKLNDRGPSAADRSPLTGSGDNRYVSIGDPKNPFTSNNFGDLLEEVRKARQEIDRPGSPHQGKRLVAWTVNDQDKIRQVVEAGAHGVVTDDPVAVNRTLDRMGYGPAGQDSRRPEVIAHRGGPNSRNYPENTLPAMEAGFKTADAIEIDIASARDGIVVFHDNNPNQV
ncbi:MAG: glycerophosphodiester phosphodiesterase family protein, partial [Candidatus Eremiobacterota bacterium]